MRRNAYQTGDARLVRKFETTLTQAGVLNRTIDGAVGTWAAFKREYANFTAKTSMVIGDFIDNIRERFFGYDPDGGLGAVQIPAAAVIATIIASALALNGAMKALFISIEGSRIQRENPNMSREAALKRAKGMLPSFLPDGITAGMLIAAGLAAFLLLSNRRRG